MTLTYDLYWSFRSPYSYLVTPRLIELERDFDVVARVRPVYPIAVRQPDFFTSNDPLWLSYFLRDIGRSAAFVGMPFRWAQPDPVVMDFATRTYPLDQPYIHRLTHLGVAAAERGRGLAFLEAVGRLLWSGAVSRWHEGDHLARAAAEAGLDLAELDAAVAAEPERYVEIVVINQAAQRDGGHYGVPLMVFEGEPFFGQDRFDQLKWRMEQQGLARR
ncbi:2-hydroxychromene-2-carboxylate isomerase [Sphingomonas sp. BE270]|jgi:2-hydroxychromene-2-carboxylate isomerase|uniref:2-hydroxychromene-2-carboxylate isomerase n=1 Tax=unclassified Sphingomonas TaxID=196159 RepID=UPI00053EF77F|nr:MULTISPECIES: DsbA family protein [unclassified Sphingomonas]MDR6846866.1 2-hydroxychromene-2-carboxylate isomerase [Sphingomonas sp. BE137]MDR7256544.1 2-hydroxychromene-2-carboxylate isomerase [Sphingomonas sp. BE270]RUN78012.1 2-hydroxychromene-2-carboxylate isomerase [Sphingomonas sp. TF3]